MPTLGSTCTAAVVLDLDGTPFKAAKRLAVAVMDRFRLEGFIILKSSEGNYHVVFNSTVSWTENMSAVAWACLESGSSRMVKWFLLQCIKGSSTLRVSPKGGKPSPRIVFRSGEQDGEIRTYLAHRRLVKSILGRMQGHETLRSTMYVFRGKRTSGIKQRSWKHVRPGRRPG